MDPLSINRTNIIPEGIAFTQKMQAYLWYFIAVLVALAIYLILSKVWDAFMRRRAGVNYVPKGQVLSPAKAKAFELICQTFPGEYEVFANMYLGELLSPDEKKIGRDWQKFSKELLKRPVDFVVVRRSDFSPVMAVAIDCGAETKENIRFLQMVMGGAKFKLIVATQEDVNNAPAFQEKISKMF
jgi:hypothetical protein